MVRLALIALACGACANNAGVPRYATTFPPPLAAAGPARPAETVQLVMRRLPWSTLVGTGPHGEFLLVLDGTGPVPYGRQLGPLRSDDVPLSSDLVADAACAWRLVSAGDPRPCHDLQRDEASERARVPLLQAQAELQAKAGAIGASHVAEVRCFARERRAAIWCEGTALESSVPAPAVVDEPGLAPTRLVIAGDGSVGMLGSKAIVASTLSLRYRPVELGFYVLDLGREGLAPRPGGLVGVGATLLGRLALGRFDALLGVSAVAAALNGSTNPDFSGLYHGFLGVAYQTPWKLLGAAQPFVQLRAGAATGGVVESKTLPMLELHVGLSSPERR